MNKQQNEVLQSQLDDEKRVLRQLKKEYKGAELEINKKIKEFQADIQTKQAALQSVTDETQRKLLQSEIQSKIYQKQYQEALKGQISAIVDNMNSQQYDTIKAYIEGCYESGYVGTMYDLYSQGIPVVTPIDQSQVIKAVINDTKLSKPLYETLGYHVGELKKSINSEISRGIASALSYAEISRNIKKRTDVSLNKAYRIARTEGHRVQNQAAFDAQHKAKEKGANIVKQWDSTLDGRTRPSHRVVDGEIRELDEKFSNGLRFPGDPNGKAAEVINCRCALLQRAKWALGGELTKYDNFTKEIRSFNSPEDYDEFKKWYFSDENTKYMKYVSDLENKYGTKDFKTLLDGMSDAEYKRFHQLESSSPLWNSEKRKKYLDNNGIGKTNKEVRDWYVSNVSLIKDSIDNTLSMEEQSIQAFNARNELRTAARDMMADQETRKLLDETKPNKTFEELVESKMKRKGMTREEAIQDVLDTSTKTNESVNKEFGIEE